MKIFKGADVPLRAADTNSFIGPAQTKLLASAEAESGTAVHVYRVEFPSGARTNWHTHSGPQWLMIVEGRIRVQRWGEAAQEVGAGDAVLFETDEKHWHGAAPGSSGTHLAVNINAKTTWLEPVTEAEYRS